MSLNFNSIIKRDGDYPVILVKIENKQICKLSLTQRGKDDYDNLTECAQALYELLLDRLLPISLLYYEIGDNFKSLIKTYYPFMDIDTSLNELIENHILHIKDGLYYFNPFNHIIRSDTSVIMQFMNLSKQH